MHKIYSLIMDCVVAIAVIFIAVLIYFGLRTETVIKSLSNDITEDFMIDAKKDGLITISGYEKYLQQLSLTGSIYHIDLEHKHTVNEPEYRFRTLEEVLEALNAAYTGKNEYFYTEVISERPEVHDPINDGNLNTETNESVLAKAINTPADENHVHTEECYSGHRHSGEKLYTHYHQHTHGSCIKYLSKVIHYYTCRSCGTTGANDYLNYYWSSTTNGPVFVSQSTTMCRNCGNTSSTLDVTERLVYAYSCSYNKDTDGDGYYNEIDYDNTYEYLNSYPMTGSIVPKATHINGCYRSHTKGYIEPNYIRPTDGIYLYSNNVLNGIKTYGIDNFCVLPKVYYVNYKTYHDDGRENSENIIFTMKKVNDSYMFSVQAFHYWESWPDVTLEEMMNITYSYWEFYDYIKKNTKYGADPLRNGTFDYYSAQDIFTLCNEPHNVWTTTCGFEEDGTLACDKLIVSLIPTHDKQVIYYGGDLITTAIATYRNGAIRTIVCTTEFSTNQIVVDEKVTLTVITVIQDKIFYNTCEIVVTIIPKNKTCENGHVYNLNNDGSDPGCLYCNAWVKNLRITYPAVTSFTIPIGTTLEANGLTMVATYYNGKTEIVTNGYVDNLDTKYLGTKLVVIGYKGAITSLMVTTVRARIICDICGYEYELYPNGENPGCPRCISETPIFTGNIMKYEHIYYTEDILKRLLEKGTYQMDTGDVLSLQIKNKSNTMGRKILMKLYPSLSKQWYSIQKSIKIRAK